MQTEFEFIESLRKKYAFSSSSPSKFGVGIGDDCAVLPKDSKTDLVITTDLLVEDIDFRLSWTNPEFLGHKALAVSLSDVAAMGAKPVWAMLSIGIPEKIWKSSMLERFYDGWFDLAKKFNVELIGGDLSKTPDKVIIDSIVAGEIKKRKAILRSGAKAGDLIFVTGELGGAAAGLRLLEQGEKVENSKYKPLLLRQLQPSPRTDIGLILGEKDLATAMIDLSDGLSSDLAHICRKSKVGAKIFADQIPAASQLSALEFDAERLEFALNGGEDFELLFTVTPEKKVQLEKALKNHKISHIGVITANTEIIELISNETSQILLPRGFRHF